VAWSRNARGLIYKRSSESRGNLANTARTTMRHFCIFIADRTNGGAIGTVLRPSSVCTECVVAKRCVLEQKLPF